MSKRFRVVAIIAAHNEEDVIGQVVGDLIAQGVEVYLLDHDSSDGTGAEVERFVGKGVIAVERFSGAGYPWEQLLRRKEQLAREIDADWFIHSDADELRESPWPDRDLSGAIATVDELGYNTIDFELFQFRPTKNGFSKSDPLREFFIHYEPAEIFDRIQIKCWKKHEAIDLASTGGHDARVPWQRVFPVRFILRHYPVRSQQHGERKIFRERKPRFHDAEKLRSWHMQYDAVGEGHSFLRDPKDLRRFDLEAARLHLWLNHRGVEALQEELRQARSVPAETRAAELKSELDEKTRQLGRLEGEADRLRERLDATHARLEELLRSRSWRWSSPARLAWRLVGKG